MKTAALRPSDPHGQIDAFTEVRKAHTAWKFIERLIDLLQNRCSVIFIRGRLRSESDRSPIVGGWMDSRKALEVAIGSIPLPGSPPRMSSDEAAIGLGFLDMALRQNHVRRITERLQLTEHLAPVCNAEIEISLNLLNQQQRNACEAFEQARQRSVVGTGARQVLRSPDTEPSTSADSETSPENIVWTPVARLPRQAVAPIDVRDSTGARLPRLTQLEVAMPLASGLYQLLRGMLGSIPDAQTTKPLGKFLHRVDNSRWLLQSALQALFISRSGPSESVSTPSTPGTRHGNSYRYREFLATVLEDYDDALDPFYNLLDVALNDYLLIVGLPQPREHHLLTYEMPLLAEAPKHKGRVARAFRQKVRGRYEVEYETHVPSSLRSYHLVAETDPTLKIDGMHITSDADDRKSESVAADLHFLAQFISEDLGSAREQAMGKIAELELRTVIGDLSQLVLRRQWEAEEAGVKWMGGDETAVDSLTWATLSGEVPAEHTLSATTLLNHPVVSGDSLAVASREVRELELGRDFFRKREEDSPAYKAHVYWRRYAHAQSPSRRIVVRSAISISDATRTGLSIVMLYVAAVLVISYVVASLLARSPLPFVPSPSFNLDGRNDALVAVLLLVPGFLYSRLDLPPRNSVAARVRRSVRWAAHATMAVTVAQAVVVAAASSAAVITLSFGVGQVLLIALLAFLWLFGLRPRDKEFNSRHVPRWAVSARGRHDDELASIDASLTVSGAEHES
ncbi:hypothetical protein AB0L70_15965 [Kribbella sp. NPDC051952]|uniref:hypothetical protein n=1 Tax=Kribbella sp. NPDC051952 TaxID=3154851 RepID=UPI00342B4C12